MQTLVFNSIFEQSVLLEVWEAQFRGSLQGLQAEWLFFGFANPDSVADNPGRENAALCLCRPSNGAAPTASLISTSSPVALTWLTIN